MPLVYGLGNKGAAYRSTRHNMGYMVVDRLSEKMGLPLSRKVAGCLVGEAGDTILARAETFMNHSGGPVAALMKKRRILPSDLVVVHDDLDLEFARMKIRWDGGDGGHKGVRSITETLGTPLFYRVKIGIGRDPGVEPEEYVLSKFRPDEAPALKDALDRAVQALIIFVEEGAEKAMTLFNRA